MPLAPSSRIGIDNIEQLTVPVLAEGLAGMDLDCPDSRFSKLITYIRLLSKWNRVYNLTAVRDPVAMVATHLLDSLSILPYLPLARSLSGEVTVLDVGAGPGLPGIPLAVLKDDVRFIELESNNKKTRFMRQVVLELELNNVEVVNQRVEDYRPDQPIDVIVSRAFASLSDMLSLAGHLCVQGGDIFAMKGRPTEAELSSLPQGYRIQSVTRLKVPGLEAERHLVHIKPLAA